MAKIRDYNKNTVRNNQRIRTLDRQIKGDGVGKATKEAATQEKAGLEAANLANSRAVSKIEASAQALSDYKGMEVKLAEHDDTSDEFRDGLNMANNPFARINSYTAMNALEGATNAAAGFGDGVSFGLTNTIREMNGTNDFVDQSTGTYKNWGLAGNAVGISTIGVGMWNLAGGATMGVGWNTTYGHAVWGVTQQGTTTWHKKGSVNKS